MKLTLIRGIPGSGKSTKARELIDQNTLMFESDTFFMIDGEYKFNYKFLGDAHKLCQTRAAYYLMRGFNVIVSNTSINIKDIQTYNDLADRYGAEFEIINCTGNWKNVHNVPERTLENMRRRFKVITTEQWKATRKEKNI